MKTLTDYWRTKFIELQKQFNNEKKKNSEELKGLNDKIFKGEVSIKELKTKISELEKTIPEKTKNIEKLDEEKKSLIERHKIELDEQEKENLENTRLVEQENNNAEAVLVSEFVRFLKKDVGYVDGLVRVLDEICPQGRGKKEEKAIIKSLMNHTEWMTNLADELSWFSQPFKKSSGTANSDILIDEVLLELKETAGDLNIKVSKDVQENIPEISIFDEHLKTVFREIIKNSFDAMPDGGTLQIDMRYEMVDRRRKMGDKGNESLLQSPTRLPSVGQVSNLQSDSIVVSISDTGRGIPVHLLEKITKPFFSTKKKISFGLGMTRVRKILDAYGGRIDISSEEDKGTVVELTFPVAEGDTGKKKKETGDKNVDASDEKDRTV